jgi:hypothetical protein
VVGYHTSTIAVARIVDDNELFSEKAPVAAVDIVNTHFGAEALYSVCYAAPLLFSKLEDVVIILAVVVIELLIHFVRGVGVVVAFVLAEYLESGIARATVYAVRIAIATSHQVEVDVAIANLTEGDTLCEVVSQTKLGCFLVDKYLVGTIVHSTKAIAVLVIHLVLVVRELEYIVPIIVEDDSTATARVDLIASFTKTVVKLLLPLIEVGYIFEYHSKTKVDYKCVDIVSVFVDDSHNYFSFLSFPFLYIL